MRDAIAMPLLRATQPLLMRVPRAAVQMNVVVDCVSNSAGAVFTGYIAGAAAGPAIASISAVATGIKKGSRSWSEFQTSIIFSVVFLALTAALSGIAFNFASAALSLVPPLVAVPLLLSMLAILVATVPVTALLTGTFASPAVPFADKEALQEYSEMQDSYRSDQWQPPKLWRRMGVPKPMSSERPDNEPYPSQGPPGYRDP